MEVHVLASGSDGNCMVVRHEGRAVMVDQGISHKRIESLMNINGLDSSEIECILVTHEHSDHVKGVGPSARKFKCPVMCNQSTFNASTCIGKVEYSPITTSNFFEVAGMKIMPMPTSHDAAEPVAYMIKAGDKTVTIATDTGILTFPVMQGLREADIAIIESNYDKHMLENGPYPYPLKRRIDSDKGHMSNVMCADAITKTSKEGRQIFLAHLSKNNNTPDVAKDTVSQITGIKRYKLDCLDPTICDDTRILKA